jgi:hypothetical protein
MNSAKTRQEAHWANLAGGNFDEAYVKGVTAVGKTHARIGLEPRWYIGGYALLMSDLIKGLMDKQWPSMFARQQGKVLAEKLSAVVKAAMLDMDYSISVYLEALEEKRVKLEEERVKAESDQAMRSSIFAAASRRCREAISKPPCRPICRAISRIWARTTIAPSPPCAHPSPPSAPHRARSCAAPT